MAINAPEEFIPRQKPRRSVLDGIITGITPVSPGETLYAVQVKHPATGQDVTLRRVRVLTTRFYANDESLWRVGTSVLVQRQSRTAWEIVGRRPSPEDFNEGVPPAVNIQQGRLSFRVQANDDANNREAAVSIATGEDTSFQITESGLHAEFGANRLDLQSNPGRLFLGGATAGFDSVDLDSDGYLRFLDPSNNADDADLYLTAWDAVNPRTITGETGRAGNMGHEHPINLSLPLYLVKIARVDRGATGLNETGVPTPQDASNPQIPAAGSLTYSRSIPTIGRTLEEFFWSLPTPPNPLVASDLRASVFPQLGTFTRPADIAAALDSAMGVRLNADQIPVNPGIGGSAETSYFQRVGELSFPFDDFDFGISNVRNANHQIGGGLIKDREMIIASGQASIETAVPLRPVRTYILANRITPVRATNGIALPINDLNAYLITAGKQVVRRSDDSFALLTPLTIEQLSIGGFSVGVNDITFRLPNAPVSPPFILVGIKLTEEYRFVG